jgi:hypothetical protein
MEPNQNPIEKDLAKLRSENALLRSLCGSWLVDVDDEILPRFVVKPGSLERFDAQYEVRLGDWHDLSNVERHTLMPLDFSERRNVRVVIVSRKPEQPPSAPACVDFVSPIPSIRDGSGYQVASLVGNWIHIPSDANPILVCA